MERGLREADVVVLPAWVEHEPRGLLQAIALGKPVIATAACGLPDELPWMRVAEGDALGLREAIAEALRLGDDQYRSSGSTSSDQRTLRASGDS